MRLLWLASGFFALAFGGLGIVLPLLPTVPFLLLATFCFGKSSPRLHDWLVHHPVYGAHIRDWRARGAIHPNAKRLATFSALVTLGISLVLGVGTTILLVQIIALSGMLVFIWSRPPA